jgi:nuclear cap-binding protein subunit 1
MCMSALYDLVCSEPELNRLGQIHFFAHLTVAKLVSAESMIDLLQSFVKVLDEFGASYARAKKAALCAAEGLMIVRPDFKSSSS